MSASPRPTWALDVDLFEKLTAERLDAHSDLARARALSINRNTIRRWRERQHEPLMSTAAHVAIRLQVPVAKLFPAVRA
jgi:hypothetical protein